MVSHILSAILCLCMISLIFIGRFTLLHCESKKRIPFVVLLIVIFLTVLGYLLEITAKTADGGFIAIKVLYIGLLFLPPVFLVFLTGYLEIKISRIITSILFIIPAIILYLVWTTDTHGLIYTSFGYHTNMPVNSIYTTKGELYYLVQLYPMGCGVISFVMLIYRFFTLGKKYHVNILLLLAGLLLPFIANVLIILNLNVYDINYTPISLTLVSLLLYINIIKHNLFDIIPHATEAALQSIKEAFILIDNDKKFLHANEAAIALLPALKNLKKERKIEQLDDWPIKLLHDENNRITSPVQFSISENNFYSANISELIGGKHALLGYIILIQDITESVMLTKKLEAIAYTDELTGIMNRRHFMSQATIQSERIKRTKGSAFIVMFDVDRFKKVNDTYGHSLGDKVLKCIAERLKGVIRIYDLFGRYGGEEFIMFISDITEDDVKKHTERLRVSLCGTPMVFDEVELTISASFGVASVMSANDLEGAIKNADEALYQAKDAGRNKVIMHTH